MLLFKGGQRRASKCDSAKTQQLKDQRTYPREVYISGATLNPAVALAVTGKTNSQLQNASAPAQKTEAVYPPQPG